MQGQKDKLYKKFKGGDSRVLLELFEGERNELYDFLMRMTGQIAKSADTVDEVFLSLPEGTLEDVATFGEFKTMLYATARRFVSDVWNADTTRLMNAAVDGPHETGARVGEGQPGERERHRPFDRAVRALPGREREIVLLKARSSFDDQEIATIMGIPVTQVETLANAAFARVSAECSGLNTSSLMGAIARMPHHPEPVRSSQRTINLSMVMQDIKTKPVGLWSPTRIVVLVLLAVAGFVYALKPELYTELVALVKGLFNVVPDPRP